LATGSCTYGTQMPGYFKVFTTKGWMTMEPAFNYDGMRLRAQAPGLNLDEASAEKDPTQFTREADHFSECVIEGKTPKSSGEEGLRDMRYIFEIYGAAGVKL
jgi:predicted dehydrogenase